MAKSMNWFTQLGVKSSVAFSLWEFSSFGVTFTWSQVLSPWKTHREAQQDSDLDDDDNEEEEFYFYSILIDWFTPQSTEFPWKGCAPT